MRVILVGGPEDGREVDVAVDRLEGLPPQINVVGDREAGSGRHLRRDADPEPTGLPFPVHVYRREAQRFGPLSRVRYTYEGTS